MFARRRRIGRFAYVRREPEPLIAAGKAAARAGI